jgi:hypothetical protein
MAELKTRRLCSYHATLEPVQHDTGAGHFGRRMIAVVTGGAFDGDRLKGKVLNGGGDWATIEESRDILRLDARVTWQTDDGAKIYVSYRGVLRPLSVLQKIAARHEQNSDDGSTYYFRTSPVFETGDARYLWLNDVVCVAIGGLIPGGVKYEVFEVL